MDIHSIISQYFNNPIMTKIKDENKQSFYFVRVQSQLLNGYRYVIAITEQNNDKIYTRKYLNNISWISLQTRTLKQIYNIPSISYHSDVLDKHIITILNRTKVYTTYTSKDFLNIQIHVLVTTSNMYEYPPEATISNALENYQTLINII
tara:strand:- start:298 stop:744 length:447 start_codon:yes stop_codon:yes gene_type:complete